MFWHNLHASGGGDLIAAVLQIVVEVLAEWLWPEHR